MKKKYGNTLFFKFSCNRILSCPGKLCKDSVKLIQGCADDLFESFRFVLRIVYCNVRHHGNNPGSAAIYSRERSRVMQWHHMRWKKVWLQMVGSNRFLPWQLSQNLARHNENYLTCVETDHKFTTLYGKSKVIIDSNLFTYRNLSNYKSYVTV